MPIEITLIAMVRTLAEVAGLFVLGQGLLWLFGKRARDGNFVYDLFKRGNTPLYRGVRRITPKFVHDAHIGAVTFFILFWIWFGLGIMKRSACVAHGIQQCV